jgi:hypothetical protein
VTNMVGKLAEFWIHMATTGKWPDPYVTIERGEN